MSQVVMRWLTVCCLVAGCGVRLEGGPGTTPDDAGPILDTQLPMDPDAPVARCSGRVVYLNFEGQALTRGAPSDSTMNRASWMTITSGAAPRYQSGLATRDQLIATIVAGVRQQLSSFPITVTTTRPTTGRYVMIVYGGLRDAVGSNYTNGVNTLDCGDSATKNDLAWISDNVMTAQHAINVSLGAIGFGIGLTATTDPADCMCGWANGCARNDTQQCRLSTMINRDPNAQQLCPGVSTQNEVGAFDAAFCQ
jgi:hypothetical protein